MSEYFKTAYNKFVHAFVKWGGTGIVMAPEGSFPDADRMNKALSEMLIAGGKEGLDNPAPWVKAKPNPVIRNEPVMGSVSEALIEVEGQYHACKFDLGVHEYTKNPKPQGPDWWESVVKLDKAIEDLASAIKKAKKEYPNL